MFSPVGDLETEPADAALVPAEMVGELVAKRLLDLARKQPPIVAEVAFEGVAVDRDPILVAFGGNAIAEVLAVGLPFGTEIGDNDRYPLQQPLEVLGKGVNRVGHQSFEAVRLVLIHCRPTLTSNRSGAST
jgi:hypothetical protein